MVSCVSLRDDNGLIEQVVNTDGNNSWTYFKLEMGGWDIYIEQSLDLDSACMTRILSHINKSVTHMNKNISAKRNMDLRTFPIFISNVPEYSNFWPGETAQIPFHVSGDWLRQEKLDPEMENSVHIINPYNIIHSTKHFEWQPHVLLHELSHGLHVNILDESEVEAITHAFEKAKERNLYRNVKRVWINTGKERIEEVAYAITNEGDYFAELSEAYFGFNDWFPHTKEELNVYDPDGFQMIENIWTRKF